MKDECKVHNADFRCFRCFSCEEDVPMDTKLVNWGVKGTPRFICTKCIEDIKIFLRGPNEDTT